MKKQFKEIDSQIAKLQELQRQTNVSLWELLDHYYLKRVTLANKIGRKKK